MEAGGDGVVGRGELRRDVGAQRLQRSERGSGRREARRPELRIAEGLSLRGQLARVPGKEREERHAKAAEGGCGAERELVDEHGVGGDRLDDAAESLGDGLRLPEEIVSASLGLVPEGRDHSRPGRGEERVQPCICVRRPYPCVAPGSEPELDVLVAVGGDKRSKRLPSRDHDPVASGAESLGDGRQRVPVGREVGDDDEDDHAATCAGSRTTSV